MTRTISITVHPDGTTTLETTGFRGVQCREASRFLEHALGTRTAETLTAEFHQVTTSSPQGVRSHTEGEGSA